MALAQTHETLFKNREEAGRKLAARLSDFGRIEDLLIVALPRGGLPVAKEVAEQLRKPLEIFVARKLGAPGNPEFGIGAITESGEVVLNVEAIQELGVNEDELDEIVAEESLEMERRVSNYRRGDSRINFSGKTVILVDDGLATGISAAAAVRSLRALGAKRVVFASPVCSLEGSKWLETEADEVICLETPRHFYSVSLWYEDFNQVTDAEVRHIIESARIRGGVGEMRNEAAEPESFREEVSFEVGDVVLRGILSVPSRAFGLVLFAHGSGSGRLSPRNQQVAARLNEEGIATFLFDLLTLEESADRENVFNIPLLSDRLRAAAHFISADERVVDLPIGYFGASTGAGAALWAASEPDARVTAIVSRGGRPDLAFQRLSRVHAPTLLIVGGNDPAVIRMNEVAQERLRDSRLEIIPTATHLFEEPGTLEQVAELSAKFFESCFSRQGARKLAS